MPKLLGLLDNAGTHGAAFKFVADTPTITMSRLKAVLTGGLPTFLDIGQSFSAAALGEDNLLGQLRSTGARVVVMGDDTWAQLAPPSSYHGCHTFPSFDVHDLHTVDDGVWREVWPYLRRTGSCSCGNSTLGTCAKAGGGCADAHSGSGSAGKAEDAVATPGWEVLVAHYLGVDHAGHTYGGNSAQMYGKLQQMDEQISQIAAALLEGAAVPDEPYHRTLLLVMGDHGQTLSGDHGGGSDEERDSVLLAFNVGAWRAEKDRHRPSNTSSADSSGGYDNNMPSKPQNGGSSVASASGAAGTAGDGACSPEPGRGPHGGAAEPVAIPQIDLTPSLALLLGLPIPFGNMGKLNRRLWQLGHGPWRGTATGRNSGNTGDTVAPAAAAAAGGETGRGAQRARYLDALRANAVQVDRYLTAYAARGGLPATELGHCRRIFAAAQEAYAAASAIAGLGADAAGSRNPVAPEAQGHDAFAQAVPKEAQARAEAAFEAFLEAAGALARRKFTRFDLPFMTAGALLGVMACLGLHAWMLVRLWCASGGRAAPAAVAVLTHPQSLALVGLVALHAFGLFSAGWIQGEGRLHCCSLAVVTLLLWLRAAVALPRAASGFGQPSAAAESVTTGSAAAAAAARKAPFHAAFFSGQQSSAGAASRQLRRQLWLFTLAAAALAANVALQRYSLIDRWGSDPHDKRQLAAAGTVSVSAPEAGERSAGSEATGPGAHSAAAFLPAAVLRAVVTLLPLLLLPLVLQALAAPQMRHPMQQLSAASAVGEQAPGHQSGCRRAKPRSVVPGWTRAAFCYCSFVLVACWWLLQLLQAGSRLHRTAMPVVSAGDAKPTALAAEDDVRGEAMGPEERLRQDARLASLWTLVSAVWQALQRWPPAAVLLSEAQQRLAPLLQASALSGLKLWAAALQLGLRWPPAATAAQAAAGAVGAVLQLPLRLLLPRLVYALALVALGRLVAVRCRVSLCGRHRTNKAAAGKVASMGPAQEENDEERHGALLLDASFCSLASSTAVLALLLGPCGPAIVLLLVVQGVCLLELLLQQQPAVSPQKPGALAQLATAPPPRSSAAVAVLAAAAGCLLSLLGGQAFFLTGHFCEFSGLQYDSPFVGFDHMTWAATPLLFWINSFGGIMLPAMALPLVGAAAAAAATTVAPCAAACSPAVESLGAGRSEAASGGLPQSGRRAEDGVGPSASGSSRPVAGPLQAQVPSPAVEEVLPVHDVGRQALVWASAGRSLALTVAVLSAGIQRHHVVVWALFAPKLVFEVCFAAAAYTALTLAALGMP
ncbi:hypothetical protein HYH02_014990 [Chlamydomonas schloesseri]|uniref:GPI ethanolamine phosphate transferase 3 n=1 Tax=Chlamydomonas schloesseri TaxID=2026947 RepID=A0A835STJ4_9CHLO|nr:hypothetical protein HYH02_014990 [Chlamydomonas schloesseri]|eukprot:KAG2425616.1 hypothetical protein HYH02_014990 [Chlamydomonas schloesseri]